MVYTHVENCFLKPYLDLDSNFLIWTYDLGYLFSCSYNKASNQSKLTIKHHVTFISFSGNLLHPLSRVELIKHSAITSNCLSRILNVNYGAGKLIKYYSGMVLVEVMFYCSWYICPAGIKLPINTKLITEDRMYITWTFNAFIYGQRLTDGLLSAGNLAIMNEMLSKPSWENSV